MKALAARAVLLAFTSFLLIGATAHTSVAAEPVPLPTEAPYIEAPQVPAGFPEDAKPTRPPQCKDPKPFIVPGAPAPILICEGNKPDEAPVVNPLQQHDPYQQYRPETDECSSFLDVGCQARHAVTGWFKSLVKSGIGPTFKFLGSTVFGMPEIDSQQMSRTRDVWGTSLVIANTSFLFMVTIAGILLMTGSSLPREVEPREILPRLVWAFLASNLSLYLIRYGIEFANGLANAFLGAGKTKMDPDTAAQAMAKMVEGTINTGGIFLIFIGLAVVVLAICVATIYIARLAITMVLIAAAPLALMFHALPFTEGVARMWWRAMSGMLAIQVCQSLVFITALQILLVPNPDIRNNPYYPVPLTKADGLDLLLLICLLYVLVRIPSWVGRTIWRQATPGIFGQLAKTFILYRGAGALINKIGRGKHRRTPGGKGGHPGGGGGAHRRRGGPHGGGGRGGSGPRRPHPNRPPAHHRTGYIPTAPAPAPAATPNRPTASAMPAPPSAERDSAKPTPPPVQGRPSGHKSRPTHGGYPRPASARPDKATRAKSTRSASTQPRPRTPKPRDVVTLWLDSQPPKRKATAPKPTKTSQARKPKQ